MSQCLVRFHVDAGEPTSAKITPYLSALPTDFSTGPLISGEYSFNNSSSSWSDVRRASAYTNVIILDRGGWTVAKVRTVLFVENRIC